MKLLIKDMRSFNIFLASISKLINSAEFTVSKESTKVCASNEIIRGYFETNSMIMDDGEETCAKFCIGEVNRLHKVMTMVARDVPGEFTCEVNFDGTFVAYEGKNASFRLKTVKRELIEKYITQPIKAELKEGYSFVTSSKDIRSVIQASNIISGDENKVYFSKRGESIFAEVDNKSVSFNDSIAIPISEHVVGNIPKVSAMRMDDFASFALLECNEISVMNVNENFFKVDSRVADDNYFVSISLFMPTVKV